MSTSLSDRLRQLRRDAGAGGSEEPAELSLADRIARLRRRPDRREELSRRVGGEWVADGVLRILSEEPLGDWSPDACHALDVAADDIPALRFVDTETTGLAGGTGTTIFLFGSGRIEGDRLVIEQWLLARPGGESAFWAGVDDLLGTAFKLVSYNGKSFDWPLVATRRRLAGRAALRPAGHVDLLHPVRRAFGTRWPDCRLATCEARILGRPRSNDLGGEFAPWAYREFLAGRAVDPLCRIVTHHFRDIVSLAELLPAVAKAHLAPTGCGADAAAIGRFWLAAGRPERTIAALAGEASAEAHWLKADAWRRLDRWEDAVALWEGLADSGDPRALEALAKFHEHRRRDPGRALSFGQRLVALAPDDPRHRHRLARLLRRAEAGAA